MLAKTLLVGFALFGVSFGHHLGKADNADKIPHLDGRIIGGETVDIEQYPYQVSLQHYGAHICGATLISERHVVTAAHCTDGTYETDLTIRAGSSLHASGGVTVRVQRTHQHTEYDPDTMRNDISVLELAEPVTFSASIQPAPLASTNPADDSTVTVSGWGRTSNGNPEHLQAVSVRKISHEACLTAYWDIIRISDEICAAAPNRDACQGDSGGPLVGNGQLVGVVSWGYGCAHPEYPGVYTSIAFMRDFIRQFANV